VKLRVAALALVRWHNVRAISCGQARLYGARLDVMRKLLLLLSPILFAGCSAETATAVCVPGISWMCTAAENACHQTKDPRACAIAQRQEDLAGLGLASGMGQLGASMQNNAASVAQTQRDVELDKLANPTPLPSQSPPLIVPPPIQPVYLGPNPNGPGVLYKAPGQTPIIMLS
jgi:hypothetical protein